MEDQRTGLLRYLFQSLNERNRPEDVADAVLQLVGEQLSDIQKQLLNKAAKTSISRSVYHYSSMLSSFAKPIGAQQQIAKATDLFQTAYPLTTELCDDPDEVEKFIRQISTEIHKLYGQNDFKTNRLNRIERQKAGLDLSRRRYNKLFRHLTRLENKLTILTRELRKLRFTKVGKSALVHELSWNSFAQNLDAACFIAYYTARCNLRSEFTIYGQQRAFDDIAEMLLKRCKMDDAASWAIAHIYPHQEILAGLSDEQKGQLLGHWFTIMQDIAAFLEEIWGYSQINRATMVVAKGNDSTTWNNTASAWNKARQSWLELIFSLGLDDILKTVCPGKAMRLMAADVAWWHRRSGNDLDANTYVWNELPLPWDVLSDKVPCTIAMVTQACAKHEIDPIKSGWIAPRPAATVVKFQPTPELVHGVSVSNPFLARTLRDAGFFSGKISNHADEPSDSFVHGEVLRKHHQRLTQDPDDIE